MGPHMHHAAATACAVASTGSSSCCLESGAKTIDEYIAKDEVLKYEY